MPWLPTNTDTLCLYCQLLSETFIATSSIKNYISGVKTLHVITDLPMDAFQAPELKLLYRGLVWQNPHCPTQAAPITPEIVLAIHSVLDFHNTEHVVFWALFLLAFFTFARKSNLVTNSTSIDLTLFRKNVVIGAKVLLVTFSWTKIIQFGQRLLIIPVLAVPNSVLRPVIA